MKHCKTFDQYKYEKLKKEKLTEGLISAAMGTMIGPKIAKSLCNALGVTKGPLYDMLNSNTFIRLLTGYLSY